MEPRQVRGSSFISRWLLPRYRQAHLYLQDYFSGDDRFQHRRLACVLRQTYSGLVFITDAIPAARKIRRLQGRSTGEPESAGAPRDVVGWLELLRTLKLRGLLHNLLVPSKHLVYFFACLFAGALNGVKSRASCAR
jgi:hypothetical protein